MSPDLSRSSETAEPEFPPLPQNVRGIETKIRRKLTKTNSNLVKSYHAIGLLLIEATEQYSPLSRYPFRNVIDWFAHNLGVDARILYDCKRFAERVPPDELPLLLQPPIIWTHIRIMLSQDVFGPKLKDVVAQIVSNRWTAADFEEHSCSSQENRRPGSGRRPQPPKNAPAGLRQLEQAASKLKNKLELALFSEQFDVAEEIQHTPPDAITTELRSAVDKGASLLEDLAAVAATDARSLRDALDWVDNVLSVRAEQEAEKQKQQQQHYRSTLPIPSFTSSEIPRS